MEAPLKVTRPRRVEVGEAQGGRENLPVKTSLKTKIQNPGIKPVLINKLIESMFRE